MKENHRILVVDDELSICQGCQRIFEEEGYTFKFALSGKEGLEKAAMEVFDVAIVDLKMPDIDGLEVMRTIKQRQPSLAMIMITGYASVPTAVEAIKLGAEDFIPKPFTPDEILMVVNKVVERIKGTEEIGGDVTESRELETVEACPAELDLTHGAAMPAPEPEISGDLVLEVLNKAINDVRFYADFLDTDRRRFALFESNPGHEAVAALLSGDIRWFEENVGELTNTQKEFLMRRLAVEAW